MTILTFWFWHIVRDEPAITSSIPQDHGQTLPVGSIVADTEDFDAIHYFGNLSPWRPISSSNYGLPKASHVTPDGCQVVQVHLLYRHGARYPVRSSSLGDFGEKIREAASSPEGFEANGNLEFLRKWTYNLRTETLTPFGRAQLWVLCWVRSDSDMLTLITVGLAWGLRLEWDMVRLPQYATIWPDSRLEGELLGGIDDLPVFRTTSQREPLLNSCFFFN